MQQSHARRAERGFRDPSVTWRHHLPGETALEHNKVVKTGTVTMPAEPETDPGTQRSVVLASFESRRAAEHMLASLGWEFRAKARRGNVTALVVSGNKDGSLKLTQSRVLTTAGITNALIRILLAWAVGLRGVLVMLSAARRGAHAVRTHKGHVGSAEPASHAILAQAGPNAAIVLVCCEDRATRQTVAARAADRAIYSWDGSRSEFLGDLDPGSKHDWVRAALGEPSSTNG